MFKKCFGLVFVITFAMTATSHAALSDGLENYWNFDNNLNDSAGSIADNGVFDGTNGTSGIGFGAGLFGGGGLEQDGASGGQENNGFVRVTRSAETLHGGRDVSISMWVQTAGFDTSWQTMIAHGEGSQYRIARRSGDSVAAYAGGSGDIPGGAIGPDISAGTGWHHIVAISEHGVSTRIWVDGGLVATGGAPNINDNGNNNPANPDLFIGANPQTGNNNREWWGEIDDVGMWDRALTQDEVVSIFRNQGPLGDLVGRDPIPEPATGLMALAGLAAFTMRRRRHA